MKARRAFRVPLSSAAVAILRAIGPRPEGVVFERESGKPFSNNALLALRDRMGFKDKCTTHGFRSSFRVWAQHQRLDWTACEMCLDHKVLDKTQGAYMRDDLMEQRREILEQWADHVNGVAGQVLIMQRQNNDRV
jgi:integrase